MHCTDIRKLRSIYGRVARALGQTLPCTGAPSASGKRLRKRLRATSPAWCQCSSCSTYVGVSGDGMQEPPNESDASVSTLIIVFVFSYLFCSTLPILFISRNTVLSELVQFLTWIRILGQNISQIILNTNLVGWRHCFRLQTDVCVSESNSIRQLFVGRGEK